jgi:putative copper resistance protein D
MRAMRSRFARRLITVAASSAALAGAVPAVLAHGPAPDPPGSVFDVLATWSFDPLLQVPLLGVLAAYLWAVRRVGRAHPGNPVPQRRIAAFVAGIVVIEVALQSVVEHYDTTLFSVHMVQHILLTLVAAPLLALGAPITLLLRVASGPVRRRWILPVLHGRIVSVLAHPVVAWLVFAGVMWVSHFSPLFNESLEQPLLHDLEHALYLGAALLFWWPVVGVDPAPRRLSHPVRILYTFLQMPQNTFLALVIYSAGAPLYAHYATLGLTWASPLEDQRLAGGLMWVLGDLLFLTAIGGLVAAWMRHEAREQPRTDARVGAQRAEIERRQALLAERLAAERLAADRAGDAPG